MTPALGVDGVVFFIRSFRCLHSPLSINKFRSRQM